MERVETESREVVTGASGVEEMEDVGQRIKTFSYKTNKFGRPTVHRPMVPILYMLIMYCIYEIC